MDGKHDRAELAKPTFLTAFVDGFDDDDEVSSFGNVVLRVWMPLSQNWFVSPHASNELLGHRKERP